jgi:hypothetical protein
MNPNFALYGYTTNDPPFLKTEWNQQKRVVDLSGKSYVFITSLYKTPWRQIERFPNANKSTIKYYSHKYGERRIKNSLHWVKGTNTRWGTGVGKSKIFGEK